MISATPVGESRGDYLKKVDGNFPAALIQRPQWLCWKLLPPTEPGKKPRKVPVNPMGCEPASTTDPSTWSSFETAAKCFLAHPQIAGLGFVFTENDPFVGVDLDKCCDPSTGEIEPWAEEIIDELSSYTEFSPSGTGVHIIVRGDLPPQGRRKGNIEMYDSGRYFTVTGARL